MPIMIDGKTGAKCAGELREAFCAIASLKEIIDRMHDDYVATGTAPAFALVEAAYLKMQGLHDDLERFVEPIFGPDSVYRQPGDDTPVCTV